MSTGTHNQRPNGSISREQLLAYAEGRSTPREQFEMELLMENDPLLEEAAEGLAMPGAIAGLEQLDKSRPGGGGSSGMFWGASTLIVLALIGAGLWMYSGDQEEDLVMIEDQYGVVVTIDPVQYEQIDPLENEHSINDGESEMIMEHAVEEQPTEAFRREPLSRAAPVEREQPTERISGIPVEPETIRTRAVAQPLMPRDRRSGRQLHYLHDLKLIHPSELYSGDPMLQLGLRHVPASLADGNTERPRTEMITMAYLEFMDEALGHFVRNDHRRTLEELHFLLDQYPGDVNALFYSGLSNFNVGRYRAAKAQLHRAATHDVDIFREEAEWYHAQTMEKSGDISAAQEVYERIANGGGFYADRALQRLK